MGCPDWPKCFGSWVPPTDVSQLPEDYLTVYKQKRIEKNEKLAAYLDKLGFEELASTIFSHPSQYIETEFNVTKTWIEYLNRLVGVLIGIFIFLTVVFAVPYLKRDPLVFYLALASFVLVGVQGWLGSIVVSTNLLPVTITVHMALALVIVAMLQYAVARAHKEDLEGQRAASPQVNVWLWVLALITFGQILLGTQVREEVDLIAYMMGGENRALWVDKLGTNFYIHRSFSILVLALHGYVAYKIYQVKNTTLTKLTHLMLVLVLVEVIAGVIMVYFAIPPVLQPIHLTCASLLFGVQFQLLIVNYYASRGATQKSVVVHR
ncbi:cytochrome c oxidase assembly protein subunit 15 [Pontibacter ummariensis]|uniref:Cytochrome c oxidase assembly protein subunit 15 n=2 Tax=Pontibacter ummariensis TaxID=1610492 RepID=A0A239KVI1_9BACT|nr:cytochrome c oxidase assembly protein subunit 15 [Pontibacter ummariensis]SNT22221.1 cytochrome c oxidase assembly protein subunit 15 [Pontibacter ummariensis]